MGSERIEVVDDLLHEARGLRLVDVATGLGVEELFHLVCVGDPHRLSRRTPEAEQAAVFGEKLRVLSVLAFGDDVIT